MTLQRATTPVDKKWKKQVHFKLAVTGLCSFIINKNRPYLPKQPVPTLSLVIFIPNYKTASCKNFQSARFDGLLEITF